jgi:hypothetical protein
MRGYIVDALAEYRPARGSIGAAVGPLAQAPVFFVAALVTLLVVGLYFAGR